MQGYHIESQRRGQLIGAILSIPRASLQASWQSVSDSSSVLNSPRSSASVPSLMIPWTSLKSKVAHLVVWRGQAGLDLSAISPVSWLANLRGADVEGHARRRQRSEVGGLAGPRDPHGPYPGSPGPETFQPISSHLQVTSIRIA